MKKLYFSCFFVLFILMGYSQGKVNRINYIPYYQAINSARKLSFEKKFDEGLKQYKKAFSLVRYVHYDANMEAFQNALQLMDYNFAGECFKNLLSQGLDSTYLLNLKVGRVQDFTQSVQYLQVMDIYPDLKQAYLVNIDKEYQQIIDSLYNIEQNILKPGRRERVIKGVYYSDSLIFENLIELIDKRGFPAEVVVGTSRYRKASDMLYRNISNIKPLPLPDTSKFDNNQKFDFELARKKEIDSLVNLTEGYIFLLGEEVRYGRYRPEDYAAMVDIIDVNFGRMPTYYWYKELPVELTEEQKAKINKNRFEFGIPPLESFKFTGKNKIIRLW